MHAPRNIERVEFLSLSRALQIPVLDVLADVLRLAQTWLRPCTNQLEAALVPLLQHTDLHIRRVRVLFIAYLAWFCFFFVIYIRLGFSF